MLLVGVVRFEGTKADGVVLVVVYVHVVDVRVLSGRELVVLVHLVWSQIVVLDVFTLLLQFLSVCH